jgi:hypothetical protein
MKIFIIIALTGLFSNPLPTIEKLSYQEKRFVKNVIKLHGDNALDITRNEKNMLEVTFEDTIYILNTKGFIHEIHIVIENEWVILDSE